MNLINIFVSKNTLVNCMNPSSKHKQNTTQILHLRAPCSSCLIWNLKTQKMKLRSHTFGGKCQNMELKLFHIKLGSNNISIVELYKKPMTLKKNPWPPSDWISMSWDVESILNWKMGFVVLVAQVIQFMCCNKYLWNYIVIKI